MIGVARCCPARQKPQAAERIGAAGREMCGQQGKGWVRVKKYTVFRFSFLYRFAIYFIFMIVVPILCSWWIYRAVLNFYYEEDTLYTQQIYMENSLTMLDASLDSVSNILVALNGNMEITHYLDDTPYKNQMGYGTFRNIVSFCEELYQVTPYLTGLKIYSDSPLVVYAPPFAKMETMGLADTVRKELENAVLQEIVWQVMPSEGEEFPALYGYQKMYTPSYSKCIGYIEVQLSPEFFQWYFDLLTQLSDDPAAVFCLYQGGRLLYSTGSEEAVPEQMEPGYEFELLNDKYQNCVEIPRLGLYVVRSGHLSDRNIMPTNNVPSIFISVIVALLLLLFSIFFSHVVRLSRRIQDFATFIRKADPEGLLPFYPRKASTGKKDEMDTLINAYNALIREKSSLISTVRKMELLSKEARYQALQAQIHPHFIYGTLESIRMTALQNKDRESADMIFSLAALIRYSISISPKAVTLREELQIASHYLKIQKLRFDDRIDYEFQIDEGLLELELPSFIIQPILENAVVYGVSQTLLHCALTVEARRTGQAVCLSVANTGSLIEPERLTEVNALLAGEIPRESFQGKSNGLALYNIGERLAIFFNGRASIRLALEENRTVTRITIENDPAGEAGKEEGEEREHVSDTDRG